MRLYRQEQPGRDWSGVMDRIALDLAALTRSKTDPVGTSPSELTNAASVDGASHETAPDRPLETETGPPNHQLRHQERIRMAETSLDRDITSSTYPASDPEDANKISILTSEENATESHHTGAEKDPRARTPSTADVLHVGCGAYNRAKLPPVFDVGWHEIRLDIDPDVHPDFVANITDMRAIADSAADAVYSSHNIEHLYPHEVSLALREMRRVLKPNGFVLIKLPDLQEVARHVAEGGLEQPLYESPMGPIAPLDILFGHRPSLESGNAFMAHRTGFTSETLGSALIKAGFAAAVVQRDAPSFCLTAIAFRSMPDETRINWAQARMLPDAGLPAVLYTQTG
jgi:SAM-dependent methyltransferase